jgi:chaperonin cofactor prefoldin
MKKMYSEQPKNDIRLPEKSDNLSSRVDILENKIMRMAEQMDKIATLLEVTRRNIRRNNTDVTNLTNSIRKK